jgi:dTDP-4-dehydrorhamnose 3,5-epimerase-like enzyme
MFYCEVLCTSQRAGIYASAAAVACLTPLAQGLFTRGKASLWLSHAARRHQVRREQKRAVTILRVDSVVVDPREGSPRFSTWEATRLDDRRRRAVFLAEGLGHAFMALTEQATVLYLCSIPYAPSCEHAVHALDPALGITWPLDDLGGDFVLSAKDAAAPSLA